MLYVGVDLGTSAVKLLLMDGKGRVEKNRVQRIPNLFSEPGLVGAEAGGLVRADDEWIKGVAFRM